jgi:pyruvate,orthophosphate dikinase
VGICGEHGGDPDSIEWCHLIGNNYVSCSPFRVPVARLAAAHAALKHRSGGGAKSSSGKISRPKNGAKQARKRAIRKKKK